MHATLTSPTYGARPAPAERETPAADTAAKPDRLTELARQALERTGRDAHKAASLLAARIRTDDALRDALLEQMLPNVCLEIVRKAVAKPTAPSTAPKREANTSARIHALANDLLDFALPGGKRLRDATADDLRGVVQVFDRTAKEAARTARWLGAIAERVPAGRTVGAVLDSEALQRLKDRA